MIQKNLIPYNKPNAYLPIEVGDYVPEFKLYMYNYPNAEAWISDFKGRLVILDFWATWCSGCIEGLPKLDSLQKAFGNKIQVILVNSTETGDTENKIRDFFNKKGRILGESFSIPTTMLDTAAQSLFPHMVIPHCVWISPSGEVKAITDHSEVNYGNISRMIQSNTSLKLPIKKDYFPNKLFEYPSSSLLIDESLAYFSFFKKGKIEGMESMESSRWERPIKQSKKIIVKNRGAVLVNKSLFDLYYAAIRRNSNFLNIFSKEKRLILEIPDSSALFYIKDRYPDKSKWETKNVYTYDLVLPEKETDSIYYYMINDINRYSGFFGRIERRKSKCMALIYKKSKNATTPSKVENRPIVVPDQYDKIITFKSINNLVEWLDQLPFFNVPVVNKSNFKGLIDINLSSDISNLDQLKTAIKQYNLDIVEMIAEADYFIISKK